MWSHRYRETAFAERSEGTNRCTVFHTPAAWHPFAACVPPPFGSGPVAPVVNSSGSTCSTCEVLRAPGGRIADEKRRRSPVSGATRRSLPRGARVLSEARSAGTAMPHPQPAPVLSARVSEPSAVGLDPGAQRLGQHPPSALTHDLMDSPG